MCRGVVQVTLRSQNELGQLADRAEAAVASGNVVRKRSHRCRRMWDGGGEAARGEKCGVGEIVSDVRTLGRRKS